MLCMAYQKTIQRFLNCILWCVPSILKRRVIFICNKKRCLAAVQGGVALACCKGSVYLCLNTGRKMTECCVVPLWLLSTLWQRLLKLITGRNNVTGNNRYERLQQLDEEAVIGHEGGNALKSDLILLRQQLNDAEKDKHDALNLVSELQHKLRASDKAKDEALSRLSEHVALKLADNNPNIADLSDLNRPTNLAEKFSTFYDDQWTDAFYALTGDGSGVEDKKAIQCLLEIVQDCFAFCREESDRQLRQLLSSYGTTMEPLPREMVKMTKDTRKKYAFVRISALQQTMLGKFGTKFGPIMQHDAIQAYIKRCTELCWLMSVQDPPMALCPEVGPNQKYDKTKYRLYMKAGEYIDYVVWPCVLIQDDGNLMSKGVAQCKDQSNSETLVAND